MLFWLVRGHGGGTYDLDYRLYSRQRPPKEQDRKNWAGKVVGKQWPSTHTYRICTTAFDRKFPHMKLKPGEGPIRVKITIEHYKMDPEN
jgi:hypothetical protein